MESHMAKETNQQPPVQGTLALGKIDCRQEKGELVKSYTLLN